jgi:hypothetical protein
MLFRIRRQLADISRVMTLEPGDIVLTGTPLGVGEVKVGEAMTGHIEVDGERLDEGTIQVGVPAGVGSTDFEKTVNCHRLKLVGSETYVFSHVYGDAQSARTCDRRICRGRYGLDVSCRV